MIYLEEDNIIIKFPEIHADAGISIGFQRTLRLPDDGNTHSLPPGLGSFPLRHIHDYDLGNNDALKLRGGVIMPMYQADALWINFNPLTQSDGNKAYPMAVKVGTGKICAVSGQTWSGKLNQDPQDYLVTPSQPWLDGYNTGDGRVRQFVAAPLGEGITAEEQVTGLAKFGGIQIQVFPMKLEHFQSLPEEEAMRNDVIINYFSTLEIGLAAGGEMHQEIYEDEYLLSSWDQKQSERCFITIANSQQWHNITGERPPISPMNAEDYTKAGLPWFHYYDEDKKDLPGSATLGKLDSFQKLKAEKGDASWQSEKIDEQKLSSSIGKRIIKVGEWEA